MARERKLIHVKGPAQQPWAERELYTTENLQDGEVAPHYKYNHYDEVVIGKILHLNNSGEVDSGVFLTVSDPRFSTESIGLGSIGVYAKEGSVFNEPGEYTVTVSLRDYPSIPAVVVRYEVVARPHDAEPGLARLPDAILPPEKTVVPETVIPAETVVPVETVIPAETVVPVETVSAGAVPESVIVGGKNDDILNGGWGKERLEGRAGDDVLNGLAGNDRLYGHAGDDVLNGGEGNDKLYGGNGNDELNGGAGDDELYGHAGNDVLIGNEGNDKLYGGGGNDGLNGLVGDDELYGHAGNDVLYGGRGNDKLYGGTGIDALSGGSGDDELRGQRDDDKLYGGRGNDKLYGNAGDDTLIGGKGNDDLYGGAGSDTFVFGRGDGQDVVRDEFRVGHDRLQLVTDEDVNVKYSEYFIEFKLSETDSIKILGDRQTDLKSVIAESSMPITLVQDTVDGKKIAVLDDSSGPVTMDDFFFLIEGTASHDTLFGSNGNDIIYGYDGQDHVSSGAGSDRIYGGDGNDVIFAGVGDDHLDGGNGDDHLNGQEDKDIFVLNFDYTGKDTVFGFEQGIDKIHIKKAHYDQIVKTDGSINIVEGVIKDADDNDVLVLQGFEGTLTKSDFSISQRLSYESVINNIGTVDENDEGADIDGLRFTLNDNIGIDDLTLVGVFEGDKAVSDKLMIKDYADGVYGLKLKDGESFDYEQRDYIYLRLEHEGANVDGGTLLIDINDVVEVI